jgi:SAM-dependent methyltransferase
MADWYNNDEFWDIMSQKLFAEKNPVETKKEIDQILALIKIKPNSKILDLCCGPGRHSLELAKRGYEVTGVDRTKNYIEQARKEASQKNLSVEFIKDDMRNFNRANYFSLIINMYTSIGYFEDQNENIQVLYNCYYSLIQNGLLLIDVVGKEIIKRKFKQSESFELNGITYIEVKEVVNNWSKIENRWIMLKDRQRKEFTFSHWLYSENDFKNMLKEAGFKIINIFGNLAGAPYNQTAERLIAVAQK